ncbi:MAG TPA: carbamoyltransferase HypF [Acidimicrobiales bacterium]|nr:carbamoyltransferase HypF [Acidimicrobiales bacterium]
MAVRVEGVVQGVGFRPFVHGLAGRLGLTGFVGNDSAGVFCEVEGDAAAVERFVTAVRAEAPPLAVIEEVTVTPRPARRDRGFAIVASEAGPEPATLVTADTATCAACLGELFDPSDRRYRYPFVNCTHCGPRFTIVADVPYDRANTTMAGFAMCALCRAEYDDPEDRRFHAQPVCCPACGPRLRLIGGPGGDPVAATAGLLSEGAVVAVKGLGGYHLAALAGDAAAVAALRARKHREDKPFALMVTDVAAAARLCRLAAADVELLQSRRRPVVVAPRRPAAAVAVAPAVAPGNRWLGVMLPYTPLHHLLMRAVGAPIVLTSGNVSDEPIAFTDDDARARLGGIADGFLTHDRAIHIRTDDSVVRSFRGRPLPLRRSRGYAPEPLRLADAVGRPVLGCGAELKSTFCLAKGRHAFVSHHIGDLENFETLRSYTEGIEHFRRLFGIDPQLVVHDMHPEYLSTKYALELRGVDLLAVQHHHAHVASCLADHGERGPVVGVAFDGLGFGPDGTIWGGEVLVADLTGYRRAAHLPVVAMPGGTAAIREPWRMAAAWLDAAFDGEPPGDLAVARRQGRRWEQARTLARSGVASPLTSSAGRLFDAVAAIAAGRDRVNYEGQAAVELEQLADPCERGAYDMEGLDGAELIRAVVADVLRGVPAAVVAARFHRGLAAGTVAAVAAVAGDAGLDTAALSGGVFQNAVFLEAVTAGLEAEGLRVLVPTRVPPNDAGISLGQVAVGGAR